MGYTSHCGHDINVNRFTSPRDSLRVSIALNDLYSGSPGVAEEKARKRNGGADVQRASRGVDRQESDNSTLVSNGEPEERKSLLGKLLSVPRIMLATVVTAAIGAAVPRMVDFFYDEASSDIRVAVLQNDVTVDWSSATSAIISRKKADRLIRDRDIFSDKTLYGSLVKANEQSVEMVIEGARSDAIRIIDMRAVVVSRRAPVSGTLFVYGPQGGDDSIKLGFDLNQQVASARKILKGGCDCKLGKPYFSYKGEVIEKGKSRSFQIIALAGPYTYDWKIRVQFVVRGEIRTRDFPEKPLTLTGKPKRYARVYRLDMREPPRWETLNPDKF